MCRTINALEKDDYKRCNKKEKGTRMREELVKLLEDPPKFHYKELWLEENNLKESEVLELFAFGNIRDVTDDMQLTALMIAKVQKLTIISLSEYYRELPYELIKRECKIDDVWDVEEYLIQLRDVFQVELDSVRQIATIVKWFDCRDVYAGEKDLKIVKNVKTTKKTLLQDLKRWKSKLRNDILDCK